MSWPTELRLIIEREPDNLDIINNEYVVVNIKNLTINKGGRKMLENEKSFKLEQLNSLKGEYEKKLEAIKAQDIVSLVNERLATVKEDIEKEIVSKHEAEISKTELKLEAINEMIAEVEAIEVEAPVEETAIEDVQEDVSTEDVEVEAPVEEFQEDISTEERPMI